MTGELSAPVLWTDLQKKAAMDELFLLGLGANLGDPPQAFRRALGDLKGQGVEVLACSRMVVSAPMGPQDQPAFQNACAWIATEKTPWELLEICLEAERSAGRVRDKTWGPRTLDLDLLWWSGGEVRAEGLRLPHPGLFRRDFVLIPAGQLPGFDALVTPGAASPEVNLVREVLEAPWYP